jgi:hypothetical protein
MELENLSSRSQDPATSPYDMPDASSPHLLTLSIPYPIYNWALLWSFPLRLSYQNFYATLILFILIHVGYKHSGP